MLLSRKFVSDYIDLDEDLTIQKIALDMTNVGNEYDMAGKLIDATNLTVGEVKECKKIEGTHLHACKVDVGKEVLDIVCGAPNVRVGLKVIVALAGAHLPGGEIKKGTIRGYTSNGMLCSKAELGLDHKFLDAKDKEGIHELPEDTPIGIDPIKVLGLDDEVIDFELTSNRGDLLSILGMAYELGAIYHKKVKDMEVSYKVSKDHIQNEFEIDIQTENCPLFLARKVKDVTIKESPDFIKNRLIASGIRPINNVVDISNYVMLETGQPLHYYDADRLGKKLIVRMANDEEVLTTLDGQERLLSKEDIVIANEKEAVGLAGVMGGLSTEVEEDTKNIIIESAIFNPTKIRKTSKKILRSEASNRFEKGLDPNRTYLAMERSLHLLEKYADAKVVDGIVAYDKTQKEDKLVTVSILKINKVLGIDITEKDIISILESLGFKVKKDKDILYVTVPRRRGDINIAEDLIEEVGRIYGMDKITGKLPIFESKLGTYDKIKRKIKHKVASLGLNETYSYTLISKDKVNTFTKDDFIPIMLNDPMSEERNTLRYSLLPSLKDIYMYNKSHHQEDISIFEVGKGFYKEDGIYKEELKLAALMTGNFYMDIPNQKVDFYIIKGIVEELLDYLGFHNRYSFVLDECIPEELHPHQSASIILQGKNIGIIGKVHPSIIKQDVYVFEINLDKLLSYKTSKMTYKDIPKFPSIAKDVAFIVDCDVTAETLIKEIKKSGGKWLTDISIFDIYSGEKIGENQKQIAFTLNFSDATKTLTDEEVMACFNTIIENVEKKCKAKLRNE